MSPAAMDSIMCLQAVTEQVKQMLTGRLRPFLPCCWVSNVTPAALRMTLQYDYSRFQVQSCWHPGNSLMI